MIQTGGGTFDRSEHGIYFLAASPDKLKHMGEQHDFVLIAVNEILTDNSQQQLESWLNGDSKRKIFIDSGIFNLTNEHMRKHGITMDEALALPPTEIDGFDKLLDSYFQIIKRFEDRCWGYIELDQGGLKQKIKTRAMIESHGLKPIPVYHPLNDGWDYFDYLAERYDRICFGNVVQADAKTRLRLVATAWERHRKYPHLWIHFLGLTPNQWLYAMPMDSGDSSSWLSAVRWTSYRDATAGKPFGQLPQNFRYKLGGDSYSETGLWKAMRVAAYGNSFLQRNWQNYLSDAEEHGFTIYPPIGE